MHRRQLLSLLACAPLVASAQDFPTRPVRLLSPFSAGSAPDSVSRMLAEQLHAQWKQPVLVDNRPGANGFLAMGAGKAAAPTGHDLVLADVGHLAINTTLFKHLPYNTLTDFTPVTLLYRTSFFIAVAADSRIQTLADLIRTAREKPGRVTYASYGSGTPFHLAGALLESETGTRMIHVPFRDGRQMYSSVVSGDVTFAMASLGGVDPLLQAGKLRLLAIADEKRSPLKPEVPTVKEAGGPADMHVSSWLALMAPHGTPRDVIAKIRQAVVLAFRQPEMVQRLAAMGFTPAASTPAELAQQIATDTEFYGELVRRSGAVAD